MTTPDIITFIRARLADEAAEAEKQPDVEEIGWGGYEIREIHATPATGPWEKYGYDRGTREWIRKDGAA